MKMIHVSPFGVNVTPKEFDRLRATIAAFNTEYPSELKPIAPETWPPSDRSGAIPLRAWRSRFFIVALWGEGAQRRLSVCRTKLTDDGQWAADITWDELQSVKAQAGFADDWMVEIYPPAEEVVNVANMRHLWLMSPAPEFGWKR